MPFKAEGWGCNNQSQLGISLMYIKIVMNPDVSRNADNVVIGLTCRLISSLVSSMCHKADKCNYV